MINEQIVLWIKANTSVYAKAKLTEYLQQSKDEGEISDILMKVISRTFQVMENRLKEQKAAVIENLIAFQVTQPQKNNNSTQNSLSFCLLGKARDQLLVPLKISSPQKVINKLEIYQLCRQVGSFLWLQPDLVKQMLQIYSKAICDLIGSARQLALNFGFCLVNLSRNKVKVRFSTKIIKHFDQKQNQKVKTPQQTHIWLVPPSQECSISQSERWSKNWQMIKQANLFDYPSLKQLQNHLNKGYSMQLKYKQRYS